MKLEMEEERQRQVASQDTANDADDHQTPGTLNCIIRFNISMGDNLAKNNLSCISTQSFSLPEEKKSLQEESPF